MDALTLDRAGVHLGAHCEATLLGLHARTRLFWGHREEDGVEAPALLGEGLGGLTGTSSRYEGRTPCPGSGSPGAVHP